MLNVSLYHHLDGVPMQPAIALFNNVPEGPEHPRLTKQRLAGLIFFQYFTFKARSYFKAGYIEDVVPIWKRRALLVLYVER